MRKSLENIPIYNYSNEEDSEMIYNAKCILFAESTDNINKKLKLVKNSVLSVIKNRSFENRYSFKDVIIVLVSNEEIRMIVEEDYKENLVCMIIQTEQFKFIY